MKFNGDSTFVPIFRSILESKQFHNSDCLKVWLWCLLKATTKPFEAVVGRQIIPLKPGQFIFGRKTAAKELNMPESTVWFWMNFLTKDGSISKKSNNKFTVVSICKWSEYNKLLNNTRTADEQQTDTYNNTTTTTNKNNSKKKLSSIDEIPREILADIAKKNNVTIADVELVACKVFDWDKYDEKVKDTILTIRKWVLGDIQKGYLVPKTERPEGFISILGQ